MMREDVGLRRAFRMRLLYIAILAGFMLAAAF